MKIKSWEKEAKEHVFQTFVVFRFPSPVCHVNFRCELRVGPNYDLPNSSYGGDSPDSLRPTVY